MLSAESCQGLAETLTETESLSAETRLVQPEPETPGQPPGAAALSGKQRRALLKRDRRKRKRQALAKLKSSVDQSEIGPNVQDDDNGDGDRDDKETEEEKERLHKEWMERERIAQEEFRLKKEKEDAAQRRKMEEEKRIREEWEEQQKKEREEQEQKQQEKRDREEAVQKMLDQAESQLENGGSWKNPDAPVDYGTEKDRANCPFFLKTGSCRFGDRCSRKHDHPLTSSTLMVRNMFVTFGMEQLKRDDYDTDASLEYSEDEIFQQFLDFYEDVLLEFRNAGKVVQFKVSCNFEPHLRGNVYVQYETEDQCKEAFMMFNGRWYAGRQLQCEFSPVTRWKTAICGLFDRQKCPKGKHCNFLHVFRNPTNEFWEADRDLHLSPDRGGGFTSRRSDRRDWTFSQRSYSPGRSHRRWTDRRSRSRERSDQRRRRNSRERRSRSRSRESQRSSSRRGHGSISERYRKSRSRERRRSHSRERDGIKDSKKRSSRRSESDSPEEEYGNGSEKKRSKSSSGCNASPDAVTSSRHHKSSKKSKKKKSKKKQKQKKSKSPSGSSSAGSGKESEDENERTLTDADKQKAEMSGKYTEITELHVSQHDNTENLSGTICPVEDESLPITDVSNSSTATETNTSLNM
ncbi:U2 small nuclear ribonucleoprotein auxiliary factor 35 kDa subunit-related protein 2 [Astyanax mexicanus]|uniref:U2 small nuclear ribonucleoprotein auxiliary factor 35 kDa subunit-related protein 2 n=2 Tax=Astyanax mexicanus TaxID=7994 RepID=A0A8T2L4N5_ASTMX|nr:U2 small nuclear ribonucleoprotein auxiliary factor 35 kDa subunit-related protein 2 [Astyanax mexicanus]